MYQDFGFFKTTMPKTREAAYHLGCLDSCVYIDLGCSKDQLIYLIRISFDGYGCCNLGDNIKYLNKEDSLKFIKEFKKEILNQEAMALLITKLIAINKEHIWREPLERYDLIAKSN